MRTVTVPANILLLGEYAVLDEGGLGVAAASQPRIVATLRDSRRLSIDGKWGDGRAHWPGEERSSLLACAVRAAAETLELSFERLSALPLEIEVDSSPFYDPTGGKQGLGSSAATAVAVCHSILSFHSGAPELDTTFSTSLSAHRAFQGGRGSGYDVAASVFGGIGCFRGGACPSFTPVVLPWLPPMWLFRGRAAIRTPDSVGRYNEWKAAHPRDARHFLEESNRCVEGFLSAEDWEEASQWAEAGGELGLTLGKAIGVPAMVEPPAMLGEGIAKAVGAGNELGILFSDFPRDDRAEPGSGSATCTRLEVEREGVLVAGTEDGQE